MRSRFRAGFQLPPRQTAVRLSPARRVALQDALADQELVAARWRHLVETIEDGLHRYRQQHTRAARLRRSFAPGLRRRLRALRAHGREIRAHLPLTPSAENELALVKSLEQLEQDWRDALERVTDRGRPADTHLSWFALAVVTALDQAGVPLKVGRKTAVVEVLGLVRQWAARKSRSSASWRSVDYEFSRVIVNAYRSNPH